MADGDAQPIKRAAVVYGRRSSNKEEQAPSAEDVCADTITSRLFRSAPFLDASGTKRSPSPDTDIPFQFGFKNRLKELDEQFDDRTQSQPGQSSDSEAILEDVQSISMGPSLLSSEASRSSADLSREPLSPSLTTLVQEQTSDSSSLHTREVQNHVPVDSEAGESSSSSSASPVRHAITTPHSRSSPTPPTSGDIPMASRKAKGKAPARDVLPLVFDGEPPSAADIPSKSKKGRGSNTLRAKTKALTKKEQREAAFESSRIAASRPVEVIRTQEQRHTLSAFFASLRKDNIAVPALGTELPSDPIERFSSPTDKSLREQPLNNLFSMATGLGSASTDTGTISRLSLSRTRTVLPPAIADSDDEMPSIASIVQQADQKHQKLLAIKQVALKHANTDKTIVNDSDDDDDLLIVKDDMHSVALQEASERRLGKAHSTPTKDRTSSRMLNHSNIRPIATPPHKLSKQELQELAKPSFARMGKRAKSQLSKKQLDQLMIVKHTEEQLKSIKRQEEEWVKRGGRLSRDVGGDVPRISLPQMLDAYAEKGLKAVEMVDGPGDAASTDESDNDYSPSRQGSASPERVDGSGMRDDDMEVSPGPLPPGDDRDDDDEFFALKHNKYTQRRPRVVESDDEDIQPVQGGLPTAQRDSASSMGSQTEDENDKENSAKLMYDRSEDKENKAIVRHEPTLPESASVSRFGSLHDFEDAVQRSGSLASVTDNSRRGSPKWDVRSPLKDISKDENDSCLSSSLFTNRLQNEPSSPPCTSASTLSLGSSPVLQSERSNRIYRLSLDSEKDENDPPGSRVFQPSFLERLRSQASPEPSLVSLNPAPNGGFSQFFSVEDQSSKKLVGREENEGLSLTLDVELKPALEVSNTLRQNAEAIFEKEQEYVVAAAIRRNGRPEEVLYVNDHGFLTQTRPEDSSPQIYRISSTKFTGTQVHYSQTQSFTTRPPLRTLSFTSSQDLSPDPQPLGRLRRRSVSPSEQRIPAHNRNSVTKLDAFSILGKAPVLQSKLQADKHEKSEYVAVEAEESDEDDMFGFGGPKEEEEEEDNDHDRIVEGLVDDALMDAETEAVDLVQEKFREHEEEDDRQLQKLHEDATKGKFRIKRRDRGVGFEDNSDEDDDDDDERRIRQRIHKKRKIQDDSLEALGQSEETRAFYDTYHQDLIDEDDEFGYLQVDASIPEDDGDAQDEEPQETVSVDEIRKRAREMAQNSHEVELLDPEDTSWVDRDMITEADDTVCVKMVDGRQSKLARRPTGQLDFDEERSTRHMASEQERKQLTSWAQNQSRYRHQGTGRSGNSTAVTGHPKAKSGGGSLRSTQPKSVTVNMTRKTKTPNLLSTVSNRSGKFA